MSTYWAPDVDLDQAGELIDDNVEGALYGLDQRLAASHRIDDLQVAMTLTDDFLGNTVGSGFIGELGWRSTSTGGGAVAVAVSPAGPGVIRLDTGASATGRIAIDLGNHQLGGGTCSLSGCPVFVQETRCRLEASNILGTDEVAVYVGLAGYKADTPPGGQPAGCYFRYSADTWWAVCARGPGGRAEVPLTASATGWHRFRVISDGAGLVRFSVDDAAPVMISSTNVPVDLLGVPVVYHGPTIEVRKTVGSAARALQVDYYTLRWEEAR